MANQREQVIEAMRTNGGYATFEQLNKLLDFSTWGTKTPQASVRRIVQKSDAFFRIQPGLWCLSESKDAILAKFNLTSQNPKHEELFTHGYYQGLIIQIGNMKNYGTYVPSQDKNKKFLETPLKDICSIDKMPPFTYPNLTKRAQSIDVIWFNSNGLPNSLFEIEHTTDIQNSISKFCDLQDFYTRFYIVAPEYRHNQFDEVLSRRAFKTIKNRVQFCNYETIVIQHSKMSELYSISGII